MEGCLAIPETLELAPAIALAVPSAWNSVHSSHLIAGLFPAQVVSPWRSAALPKIAPWPQALSESLSLLCKHPLPTLVRLLPLLSAPQGQEQLCPILITAASLYLEWKLVRVLGAQ